MLDWLMAHGHEIGVFVAGLITGSGSTLLGFKLTRRNNVQGGGTVTDQSGAKAGGSIAGRDIRNS